MELVTHESAVMLEQDQAQRLLLEMAAVVRTIFGVQRPDAPPAPAAQVAAVATADTAVFPGTSVSAVAIAPSIPTPAIAPPAVATPAIATPAIATPALPVPALAVPPAPVPALAVPVLDHGDPEERHSLALLQEIAFLDE